MEWIIIQAIGFIGVVCCLLSFQIKSNKALYTAQMLGSICFSVQFFLLGGISGCLNVIMVVCRNILMMKINDWKWLRRKEIPYLYSLIGIALTISSWQNWTSILPLIAVIGGNIGFWSNNAQKIRLWMLICVSPSWMLYDFLTGSIAGVLNELFSMISILISAYRFGWKAMGKDEFVKK